MKQIKNLKNTLSLFSAVSLVPLAALIADEAIGSLRTECHALRQKLGGLHHSCRRVA